MGELSKALGMGATIDFEGKTYTLAGWTKGVQASMEMLIEQDVLKKARQQLLKCSIEDKADSTLNPVSVASRDIREGLYSFGSVGFSNCLKNKQIYWKHALVFMLQENHPEANMDLVERIYQGKWDEMMEAVQRSDDDPNSQPPT